MYKAFERNKNGSQTIHYLGLFIKGNWVYGDLLKIPYDNERYDCYIIEAIDHRDTIYDIYKYAHQIMPETVCEAVPGLKDSQGNQIYNHDIVECRVVRCGGTWYNWGRTTNINHGKCRTLPLEICYLENVYDSYGAYVTKLTNKAKLLIEEYEKPIGNEKTRQYISWYNPNKEDLIAVVGTIFDKEN